jgi:hypothetical protein
VAVFAVTDHQDQLAVPARDEEADEGEGGGGERVFVRSGQPVRIDVGFEVVDRDEGPVKNIGEGFGDVDADEERTGETGSLGDGDRVDLAATDAGLGKGSFDDGDDGADVTSGGQLRDDAAVRLVERDLGRDDVGTDAASVDDHRGGGFVARGFDAEDVHRRWSPLPATP